MTEKLKQDVEAAEARATALAAEVERLGAAPTDGNRPLPFDRDELGRMVREAWVRWAETQPFPKPSWLVPYDELPEPDKEADRQIGETIARWTLIGDAARSSIGPTYWIVTWPGKDQGVHAAYKELEEAEHAAKNIANYSTRKTETTIVPLYLARASPPTPVPIEGLVERAAQWLHDEVEYPEHPFPHYSWPDHPDDTGQRGDGWLKIVPKDVQEQFRDIAKRLVPFVTAAALTQMARELRETEELRAQENRKLCDETERRLAAEARATALAAEVERLGAALTGLVEIIDAAGLFNLSNGVQLGQTSWYVKASDRLDVAHAALEAKP